LASVFLVLAVEGAGQPQQSGKISRMIAAHRFGDAGQDVLNVLGLGAQT
jgi:hypothetical protein